MKKNIYTKVKMEVVQWEEDTYQNLVEGGESFFSNQWFEFGVGIYKSCNYIRGIVIKESHYYIKARRSKGITSESDSLLTRVTSKRGGGGSS